jgi:hypothetical protein
MITRSDAPSPTVRASTRNSPQSRRTSSPKPCVLIRNNLPSAPSSEPQNDLVLLEHGLEAICNFGQLRIDQRDHELSAKKMKRSLTSERTSAGVSFTCIGNSIGSRRHALEAERAKHCRHCPARHGRNSPNCFGCWDHFVSVCTDAARKSSPWDPALTAPKTNVPRLLSVILRLLRFRVRDRVTPSPGWSDFGCRTMAVHARGSPKLGDTRRR